jgi:hypothetical protein
LTNAACNSGWYYGYQSPTEVHYTTFTLSGQKYPESMALGGYVESITPAGSFKRCALIEYWEDYKSYGTKEPTLILRPCSITIESLILDGNAIDITAL